MSQLVCKKKKKKVLKPGPYNYSLPEYKFMSLVQRGNRVGIERVGKTLQSMSPNGNK